MSEIVYTHRTRSGLKARIICNNAKGEYPIVALIFAIGLLISGISWILYLQTMIWS